MWEFSFVSWGDDPHEKNTIVTSIVWYPNAPWNSFLSAAAKNPPECKNLFAAIETERFSFRSSHSANQPRKRQRERSGAEDSSEVRSSTIENHSLSIIDPTYLPKALSYSRTPLMTRITNVGRKRAHVEPTFDYNEVDLEDPSADPLTGGVTGETAADVANAQGGETTNEDRDADGSPPKKKRKRGPRKKAGAKATIGSADGDEERGDADGEGAENKSNEASDSKGKKRKAKMRTVREHKEASEKRRRRRIAERNANTTCFACRDIGHAVQDCPKIADGSIKPPENQSGFSATGVVGICYRCGSRKHRLSACREKVSDPSNPLPFASCFVCNGNGHLASRCPENKEKGVYPNGGSCKLCGETDHLARNCKLRDKVVAEKTTFFGTGTEAGADEDDFHAFKRKSAEVDKEQKAVGRVQKSKLKNASKLQKKKVVNF